ncbi:hypothetical protein BGAL_0570g00030 [Botrytis galanthina]|uniref:Uncharacterized protein n=1 Tax=Botrytis galanthina TaxID=278940 RepID=A0A4V4HTA8_9HELO|nr:hypothetical protein BGAL_0570g00030 [Botrytis galanthina]
MSQHGSYAERDDRSIASHSRTANSLSMPRKREDRGPPIAFNNRRPVDAGSSSNGRSRSRSGSVRTPSVAPGRTARTPSHSSGSISRGGDRSDSSERHRPLRRNGGSVTNERSESVSSDGTVRLPKPRIRDADYQAFDKESYTSGRKSHTSEQYNGYTSSHDDDRRSHRDRSASELAGLSEQTESLNLRDPNHDRVAKWNKGVERETREDRWDGDPTTGLRSVNREGSNAPSSIYKGRSDKSRDFALEEYRDDRASHKTRSDTSRDFAFEEYRRAHAPSVSRSQRPRNPPPSYGGGTYVDGHHNIGSVDLRQTHMHKTTIHGPDMSFMNGPSKKELRKMREHELEVEMIRHGMRPRKGFWE